MQFAKRVGEVPPYIFVQITRKIAEKKALGIEVISFGIGDPDRPTPDHIVESLREAALQPSNHVYPDTDGLLDFKKAVASWYQRRFGIVIDADKEVMTLIGAKEGIGHAALCFIDPGDIALVPDPGYPVYSVGTLFAGGETYWLPLKEENGWLVDLDAIPEDVARKAKMLWLNYPNNPTGATADLDYFNKVVRFAKEYDVAVLHDACYTEIAYDGFQPVSFLQAEGAMDVALEFHSLSKTYNMTGWRIGMLVGNAEMIENMLIIKSNLDSGVPQAVQRMAIEALNSPLDVVDGINALYQSRRDRIVPVLRDIGMHVDPPRASLYIWARVPDGYTSAEFSELVLEETNVLVSPGSAYGPSGEGYVRLSMTVSDDLIDQALERLSAWRIPAPAG